MTDFADLPLDSEDQEILHRLAAIYTRSDPPPADLDQRVLFAIALDDVDVEVARLSEDLLVGSGARGTERTRTITFDAESRTVMVTVVERQDGQVRLDGWLAPPAALEVELRILGSAPDAPASSRIVAADAAGRFVFDQIPHGLAQLLVHPADDSQAPRVVTPSLVL
jgi:hypothetical protein